MELELGLALPNHENEYRYMNYKKYINHDNDDEEVESKNSSSLVWGGSGDHPKSRMTIQQNEIENEEEDEDMEGWPPINSWRKEALHRHDEGGGWGAAAARNSMFVKVKMAGVPIGRKIDLARFDSYQALTHTLINMFVKYTKNEMREGDYTILYKDNEGDWLLAGDVPWEIFVESVHRMEIQRNAN